MCSGRSSNDVFTLPSLTKSTISKEQLLHFVCALRDDKIKCVCAAGFVTVSMPFGNGTRLIGERIQLLI